MVLKMRYFVLKPESKRFADPYAAASRRAMREYADAIELTDRELASDLRKWATAESNRAALIVDAELKE